MKHSLSDRNVRRRDLVPPERPARTTAVVLGVGAVGRQAALQLTAVGVPRRVLVDFDSVEPANPAPQGFRRDDLGRPKVDAVGEVCHDVNPMLDLRTVADRFRRSMVREWTNSGVNLAVFCCVDMISSRKAVWEAVRPHADFFGDARMAAEVVRVPAGGRPADDGRYAQTLFSPEQAFAGSCTAKATIYTANIAAGLMLSAFAKWLRGLPVDPDVTLNLPAGELMVG